MENPRWWHLAIVALSVALCLMLLLVTDLPQGRMLAAQATLVAFVIAWFTFGRLSWTHTWAGITFIITMTVLTGVATAMYPSMATLQCVVYPLIWVISRNRRGALIANVAVALAVAVGLAAANDFQPGALLGAGFVAALSLGFSIALGLWISHIFDLSAERERLIDELRAADGRLAALHREAGIASERERLSRELHDTIAQDLTGLVMLVQGTRRTMESGDFAGAAGTLALIEESARGALAETRSLVAAGASVEVPGGIMPALRRLTERFERESGITVTARTDQLPALDRGTEVVLLRCAQEALANIRKHSYATTVEVSAEGTGSEVELRVTDNGVGFATQADTSGFGLAGMRDRLALVDGSLAVASSGSGTVLTVRVPVVAVA